MLPQGYKLCGRSRTSLNFRVSEPWDVCPNRREVSRVWLKCSIPAPVSYDFKCKLPPGEQGSVGLEGLLFGKVRGSRMEVGWSEGELSSFLASL